MNNIIGLDKIYVLHHPPMIHRGERIKMRLLEESIEYELVTNFPPEEIDYEKELEGWNTTPLLEIPHPYGGYISEPMKISLGSLSLVLKHLWCYRKQIENNYENILILEDDVFIPNNFKQYLINNMIDFLDLQKSEGVSMLMVGISHQRTSKAFKPGKWAHYGENQKTRCTHAYITNIEATKKIVANFYPINNPIDFRLDSILTIQKIKVAWSEPGLIQN